MHRPISYLISRLNLRWFSAATLLALATVLTSMTVAYLTSGSPLATVSVADLYRYGGATFADIANFEVWRLATAQLLHAKFLHMLWNALGLLVLGSVLESAIGGRRLLLLWLIAGGFATLLSPVFAEAPWNVGTGASQAAFAFAACTTALVPCGVIERKLALILVASVLVLGLALDFAVDGMPKVGHVAGFLLGKWFGMWLARNCRAAQKVESQWRPE